jgi:CHASE2 domain-containing sensor protein
VQKAATPKVLTPFPQLSDGSIPFMNLVKALKNTATVVLAMVSISVILNYNLLGPLSVLIKREQNGPLDTLTRAVHRWGAPKSVQDFPLVVQVDLGKPSVDQLSPVGYVFNRGQMAEVVQKVLEYSPKAMFLDFDLSEPTNEGGVLSAGDKKLLQVLKKAQSPILLPDAKVLGFPLEQVNPNLHRVAAQVVYDSDGQARWIPVVKKPQTLPTSLALYCRGKALPETDCYALGSGEDGKRIVFRQIQRERSADQLWSGLVVLEGTELLQDGLVRSSQTEGAVFLVGRTYPYVADAHFTPIGAIQGIDIHLNALMTLATYQHFSETLGWGPLLVIIPLLVFLALWATYSIIDGLLAANRFQDFVKSLIELAIMAWILFFAGIVIVQYFGYFLDYLFPIAAFQLVSLLLKALKPAVRPSAVAYAGEKNPQQD